MRVVVDTNVWVSGLILPDSVPGQVVGVVRRGVITPVASWELAEEIAGVLRRPRIRRYGVTEQDVEDVLFVLAPFLPGVEVDVEIRDPADAPVIEAAVAGRAEAIVTGDLDLLDGPEVRRWLLERGVDLFAPRELLVALGIPVADPGD